MKLTPQYPLSGAELALACTGFVIGLLILAMSADLATGGALSSMFSRIGPMAAGPVLRAVGKEEDSGEPPAA